MPLLPPSSPHPLPPATTPLIDLVLQVKANLIDEYAGPLEVGLIREKVVDRGMFLHLSQVNHSHVASAAQSRPVAVRVRHSDAVL